MSCDVTSHITGIARESRDGKKVQCKAHQSRHKVVVMVLPTWPTVKVLGRNERQDKIHRFVSDEVLVEGGRNCINWLYYIIPNTNKKQSTGQHKENKQKGNSSKRNSRTSIATKLHKEFTVIKNELVFNYSNDGNEKGETFVRITIPSWYN